MSIEQDFIDAVGGVIDGIGVTERINDLEHRVTSMGHELQGFDNVADANSVADLHILVGKLTRRLDVLENATFDTAGSASRQHYIDTGRYLTHAEVEADKQHDYDVMSDSARLQQLSDRQKASWADPMQHEQRGAIFGLLRRLGCDTFAREARLGAINAVLGHNGGQGVSSFVNLTEVQADEVITALETAAIVKEALA